MTDPIEWDVELAFNTADNSQEEEEDAAPAQNDVFAYGNYVLWSAELPWTRGGMRY